MDKKELETTLGIKNKTVEKYFENQVALLLRLISDFHLPYKLKLELDKNAKEDKYSSTYHYD